ncbi:hypothetical protein [Cohnella sp. OV330]|uniref:hypothetical protein n=1 Tax=Cohnella sp. OV330 TaxID=1855288 RepID=UPI0011606DC0|nr:hypothetical protein [Cohnella sp. OV330]
MKLKRTLFVFLFCIALLSGCAGKDNPYKGIEKKDIAQVNSASNLEFVNEYRGYNDNWAAVYIVFKLKDNANHTAKLQIKYIGEEAIKPGELKYSFNTLGGGDGNGVLRTTDSVDGIFNLGSTESNGSVASPNSIVKVQLQWNGKTDTIDLHPAETK